jgi:hypothetical protein
VAWQSRLVIVGNRIEGHLALHSRLDRLAFSANEDVRPEIVKTANDVFSSLQILNATVQISGTIFAPDIELQSDVGEQVASGVKVAFTHQMQVAKERLISEVSDFADEHVQTLRNRFAADYDRLLLDNAELIREASEIQNLMASLRSGNMDARGLMKQVSTSSIVNDKDREKLNGAIEKIDSVLDGQIPPGLQGRFPKLPGNLPNQPDFLSTPSGNFPLNPGRFQSLLPTRSKQSSSDVKMEP